LSDVGHGMRRRVRKHKAIIDQVAAQQILQDYFDLAGTASP
jgi:RNase H-fold protein (predicted Holliday junction resolvase)